MSITGEYGDGDGSRVSAVNRILSSILDFVIIPAAATAVVVSVAALMPTPAEAGTNAGNDNHRRDATTILRQSVDGAWSYVGCFAEALRGPVRGDFQ